MDTRYRSLSDPSPIWDLHCALGVFVMQAEQQGEELPDDLCICVSVEMHAYMVRYYKSPSFSIRGLPVIPENCCPNSRIVFISQEYYRTVTGDAEYWR